MSNSSSSGGGVGVLGLLGVVFVTLKLLGYIEWPWIWVTAPFWLGFAVLAVVLLVALIVALIVASVASVKGKRK